MDSVRKKTDNRKRFEKLSLRKNKQIQTPSIVAEKSSIVVLDDSIDNLQLAEAKVNLKTFSSPIIIEDSVSESSIVDDFKCNLSPFWREKKSFCEKTLHTPKNYVSVASDEANPSKSGWSPPQTIICTTPKHWTPSSNKDIVNESLNECSLEDIQLSHKKILDELYGDEWKTVSSVKKKHKIPSSNHHISTKLNFLDELDSSDKENDKLFSKEVPNFKGLSDIKIGCGDELIDTDTIFDSLLPTSLKHNFDNKAIKTDFDNDQSTKKKVSTKGALKQGKKLYTPTPSIPDPEGDALFKKKHHNNEVLFSPFPNVYKSIDCSDVKRKPHTERKVKDKSKVHRGLEKDYEMLKPNIIKDKSTENKQLQKLYTSKSPEIQRIVNTEPKVNPLEDTEKKLKQLKLTDQVLETKSKNSKSLLQQYTPDNIKKLSFMASLADNVPKWRCDPEALRYKENYKTTREELTRRLFIDFNKLVFGDQLDKDMPVVWDSKLRTTAGTTTNRQIKNSKLEKVRTSSIKLSTKIIDRPERLRDTLIHEMCHAATWLIDNELRAAHGPLWKKWATRSLQAIPELVEISRCHSMEIHFKYTYKCTTCGYSINRHSKSIDSTKKCCGYCRGTFNLIVNKKTKTGLIVSTPAKSSDPTGFALFVKENYSKVKHGKTHAEAMKVLGGMFADSKIGLTNTAEVS